MIKKRLVKVRRAKSIARGTMAVKRDGEGNWPNTDGLFTALSLSVFLPPSVLVSFSVCSELRDLRNVNCTECTNPVENRHRRRTPKRNIETFSCTSLFTNRISDCHFRIVARNFERRIIFQPGCYLVRDGFTNNSNVSRVAFIFDLLLFFGFAVLAVETWLLRGLALFVRKDAQTSARVKQLFVR